MVSLKLSMVDPVAAGQFIHQNTQNRASATDI